MDKELIKLFVALFLLLLSFESCVTTTSALWWSGGGGNGTTTINNYYGNNSYNITYENYNTSYGKYWYNQSSGVAGGSSYNETYHINYQNVSWLSANNLSYLSTYNSTYAIWAYNQTYIGGIYNVSYDAKNTSQWIRTAGNIYYQNLTGRVGIGTTSPTGYGGVSVILGIQSATAPELSLKSTYAGTGQNWVFVSDTNGDFYITNTSYLPFYVKGISGDVGIRTIAPISSFDVRGNVSLNNTLYVTNNGRVGIGTTDPYNALTVSSPSSQVILKDSDYPASGADYNMGGSAFNSNNGYLSIQGFNGTGVGGSYRLTINQSTGNIGMGSSAGLRQGSHTLSVGGTSNITGNAIFGGNVGISAPNPEVKLQVGTPNVADTLGGVPVVRFIGGINNQTPQTILRLARARSDTFYWPSSVDFNVYSFDTAGAPDYGPGTQLDIALKSATNGAETANTNVMTLRDNGNVGIGITTPSNKLNVVGDGNFSGTVYVYDNIDLATFSAGQTFFLWNNSASITNYKVMNETSTGGTTKRAIIKGVSTNGVVANWTSPAGALIGEYIPSGIYTLSVNALSNASVGRIYGEIYKRSGTVETLMGTTGTSASMSGVETTYNLVTYITQTGVNASDTIVLKIKSAGNAQITLYVGGTTFSSLRLPSSSISKINFVTFTGATQNLDLGNYGLFADFLNATTAYIGNGYHWFTGSILREENGNVGNVTVGNGLFLTTRNANPESTVVLASGADSPIVNIYNFTATNVLNDFYITANYSEHDDSGDTNNCRIWLAKNSTASYSDLFTTPIYNNNIKLCTISQFAEATNVRTTCRLSCLGDCDYGTSYSINAQCQASTDDIYRLDNISVRSN